MSRKLCKWISPLIFAVFHRVHSIASVYMVRCLLGQLHPLLTALQNDDFYMTSPLTPVTFYTHRMSPPSLLALTTDFAAEYGFVLRIQSDITVAPDWPDNKRAKGEWRSMGASNWLLSV